MAAAVETEMRLRASDSPPSEVDMAELFLECSGFSTVSNDCMDTPLRRAALCEPCSQ